MYRPHPVIRPGTALKVTIGAAHAESTAVGACVAMLVATSDCHIVVGLAPVATTNSTFLPAKVPIVIACLPTDVISVIQDAGAGTLFITPGA